MPQLTLLQSNNISNPQRFLVNWMAIALLTVSFNLFFVSTIQFFITQLCVILVFSCFAIRFEYSRTRTILSPPVVATAFFFILSNCIDLFLIQKREAVDAYREVFRETPFIAYFNRTASFTLLAAVAMWAGYYSNIGRMAGEKLFSKLRFFLRVGFNVSMKLVVSLYLLVVLVRLFMIKKGVYGFLSDFDTLMANAKYKDIISYFDSLGVFLFFLISILFFKNRSKYLLLVVLIGVSEFFFALIAGFKFGIIKIPMILLFGQYIATNKINKSIIVVGVLTISIAYAIIEPYRQMVKLGLFRNPKDIREIVAVYSTVLSYRKELQSFRREGDQSVSDMFLLRNEILAWSAYAIRYKDSHGLQPHDPNFLGDTFLAPVYAFVPRFIMPSKPIINYGQWFTRVMDTDGEDTHFFGADISSSTAMGPVGFLYLTGGLPFILLGFTCLGFFYRVFFECFFKPGFAGGYLIFFANFPAFISIDSIFFTILIGFIRVTIMMLIVQRLVLRD